MFAALQVRGGVLACVAMTRGLGEGHELVLEGDLVRLTLRGQLLLADAQAMRAHVEQVLAGAQHCYILADLREMTTMEPAARRYLGEWGRTAERRTVTAIFGMSSAVRVLTTLLLNAIRVLGRSGNLTRFANDEAEARAWLAEYRRQAERGDDAHGG